MTVMFDNVHHPHVGLYDFIEISRELVKKHDETELTVILWSFMERHWTLCRKLGFVSNFNDSQT